MTDAVGLSTITRLSFVAISINVVVECQLLALLHIALSKDAHPHVFSDLPFGDVTVWVTAVINESGDASFFRCVEILVLLEHHEVEMRDALIVIAPHPFVEIFWIDDLSDVFVHKRLCRDGLCCSKTIALFIGLDNLNISVLSLLEALVLAMICTSTIFAETLDLREAIDAASFIGASF